MAPVVTRTREMSNKSSTILTANLAELMTSGTSGLSRARAAAAEAVSTAELSAENALRRTYYMQQPELAK